MPHVLLANTANGSDPEAVGTTQLARIDEEAARAEIPIEIFESEVRIIRTTKRSDDVALSLRRQIFDETKLAHSRLQRFMISVAAGGPSGDAAFFAQFFECFSEG